MSMVGGRLSRTLAVAALLFVAQCARPGSLPTTASLPSIATTTLPSEPEAERLAGPPRPDAEALELAWAKALAPLTVECANTGARTELRLYENDGSLDASAIDSFSFIAADLNGPYPLTPRVVQLAVKAATHFHSKSLVVVSGYRKPQRKGATDHHSRGEALDFKLPGVDYRKLAAYLRTLPRVGVGVYTDPRTHYVHLDVRETSFHWLDASPPGVTWREARLPDANQAKRDASYSEESDLPIDEG